jgi:hypothetical protein
VVIVGKPRNQFTFYKSYYDAIQDLPKRDQSALILAVCAYAIYEEPPKGLSIAASTAFKLIKPTLDSGRKKAENGSMKGKANESNAEANGSKTEAKKSKMEANRKQGETESKKEKEYEIDKEYEFEVEADAEGEGNAPDCGDDYNEVKVMGGKLGRNVIRLSQAQSDSLLDKIGFTAYNHYLARLADFIINNGAAPANHYETILKWWNEDRKV